MNREPVTVMLDFVNARVVRETILELLAAEVAAVSPDRHPLRRAVLEDVLDQVDRELSRPCVECTRDSLLREPDTNVKERFDALQAMTTWPADSPGWVRRDVVREWMSRRDIDPTVTYELACGHVTIDF